MAGGGVTATTTGRRRRSDGTILFSVPWLSRRRRCVLPLQRAACKVAACVRKCRVRLGGQQRARASAAPCHRAPVTCCQHESRVALRGALRLLFAIGLLARTVGGRVRCSPRPPFRLGAYAPRALMTRTRLAPCWRSATAGARDGLYRARSVARLAAHTPDAALLERAAGARVTSRRS